MSSPPHPGVARRIDVALALLANGVSRARRPALLAEVAAAAGCTVADLDAWRSGAAPARQGDVARLAPALGLTFLWLAAGCRSLPVTAPRRRAPLPREERSLAC